MMMTRKQQALRIFFVLEIAIFGYTYLFGVQGLKIVMELQSENNKQERRIAQLTKELNTLEGTLHTWQATEFYREKIAREQLQMAHQDEEIYYLT